MQSIHIPLLQCWLRFRQYQPVRHIIEAVHAKAPRTEITGLIGSSTAFTIDALAAETDETVKAEMTSAFLTACRMELHLMEAAWRGLTWEPVAKPH